MIVEKDIKNERKRECGRKKERMKDRQTDTDRTRERREEKRYWSLTVVHTHTHTATFYCSKNILYMLLLKCLEYLTCFFLITKNEPIHKEHKHYSI